METDAESSRPANNAEQIKIEDDVATQVDTPRVKSSKERINVGFIFYRGKGLLLFNFLYFMKYIKLKSKNDYNYLLSLCIINITDVPTNGRYRPPTSRFYQQHS